jgi:hypothetical protein
VTEQNTVHKQSHKYIFSNCGTSQPTVEDEALIVQAVLCAYFHHSICHTATQQMVHPVTFSTGFIKTFFTLNMPHGSAVLAPIQFHLSPQEKYSLP